MGNDPESVEVDEKLRVLGGVVENGKLTRLGVILAGAKESVLNTPEIKEIVEKRTGGIGAEKAFRDTWAEIVFDVSRMSQVRAVGGYSAETKYLTTPGSEAFYLEHMAGEILEASINTREGGNMGGRILSPLEAVIHGSAKKFKNERVAIPNPEGYAMDTSEAITRYLRYLEGLEPEFNGPEQARGEFYRLVDEKVTEHDIKSEEIPTVIILPGVGRNSQSVDVKSAADFLTENGIRNESIDWPPFAGNLATFEAQADWLSEELDRRGLLGKQVIIYGHSKGDLTGRHFVARHGERVAAYIGSCGPARSRWDLYPEQIAGFLKFMTSNEMRLVREKLLPVLADIAGSGDEFKRFLLANFGEAAATYLRHIDAGDAWDRQAELFPPHVPTVIYYGLQDGIVEEVGRGAAAKIPNALVLENPVSSHKMIPNDMLLKVIKHVASEALVRGEEFAPDRLWA